MYINKLECVKVKEDQPNKNKKKELFNMHPSVHIAALFTIAKHGSNLNVH